MKANNKNQYTRFFLFWMSQTLSQLGSAMTGHAIGLYVYQETGSVLIYSLLTFFNWLPYIIGSAAAGPIVDKYKKKLLMVWTDGGAFVCTLIIFGLLIKGEVPMGYVYAVNAVSGLLNAVQNPASTVVTGILAPKQQYEKVSGLNSMTGALLTIAAPAAAFVISVWGLQGVLLTDFLTFSSAVIILVCFVKVPEQEQIEETKEAGFYKELSKGFIFVKKQKTLLYMMLSMAVINFLSQLTYQNILTPMLLARGQGGYSSYAVVNAVLGVGGIAGGFLVTVKKKKTDPYKLIYFSAALSFLGGDLLMGMGRGIAVWAIAAAFASVPIPFLNAGQNVIIYREVPGYIQGRVFAVRNTLQYITIPAGILLGGMLADYVFEPMMRQQSGLSSFFARLTGGGEGSGMAVMFLFTALSGAAMSLLCYRKSKKLTKESI